MQPTTTCQICGRGIKAKAGTIAHHGYRRPGSGWQTASCWGARHAPYEQGKDALETYIPRIKMWREQKEVAVKGLQANPPRDAECPGQDQCLDHEGRHLHQARRLRSEREARIHRPTQLQGRISPPDRRDDSGHQRDGGDAGVPGGQVGNVEGPSIREGDQARHRAALVVFYNATECRSWTF